MGHHQAMLIGKEVVDLLDVHSCDFLTGVPRSLIEGGATADGEVR